MDADSSQRIPKHRALRRLRRQKNLTQTQAALKTGFAPETISAWENGRHPTRSNLETYLEKMGCTPEEFGDVQLETLREELGVGVAMDIEVAFNERLNKVQKALYERSSELSHYDYYKGQLRRCGILWALCLEELEGIEEILVKDRDGQPKRSPAKTDPDGSSG